MPEKEEVQFLDECEECGDWFSIVYFCWPPEFKEEDILNIIWGRLEYYKAHHACGVVAYA